MKSVFAWSGVVIKGLCRRKDFYVLFVLTALITLVLGSVNFFNDPKIIRYLKDICLLLVWISSLVIAITTAARQIPAERDNRTIFPLLAKPVTRGQVIVGKFIGCWLACGFTLLVFYVFFTVVSGSREQNWNLEAILKMAWLHWVMLGIVVAMVLSGSIIFSAPSANITICFIVVLGILGLGRYLHRVALQQTEPVSTILTVIYFAIPHLEWYDVRDFIVYDQHLASWADCGLATLYGAAYMIFFMCAAWVLFRRKTLTV